MHKEEERTKKVIFKYSHFVLKDSRAENNLNDSRTRKSGNKNHKNRKRKKKNAQNANFMARGPFLQRTGNFSGPKANF